MPKKNRTKFALLGMLSFQPMSGYDINKVIDQSIGYFWSESYSQIYPNLKALEEDRLASVSVEEGDGTPNRKVYTITEKGMEELREWLKVSPDPEVRRIEMLLKLFYGFHVDPAVMEAYVRQNRTHRQELVAQLKGIEAQLLAMEDRPLNFTYQLMVVQYGIAVESAVMDWCDQSLAMFDEIAEEN